jgi:hypothetical protein
LNKEIIFETSENGIKKSIRLELNTGVLKQITALIFQNGFKIIGASNGINAFEDEEYVVKNGFILNEQFAHEVGKAFRAKTEIIDSILSDIEYIYQIDNYQNQRIDTAEQTIILKADKTYVDTQNSRQNITIALKADKTYVDS